jgi:hypothetical protein
MPHPLAIAFDLGIGYRIALIEAGDLAWEVGSGPRNLRGSGVGHGCKNISSERTASLYVKKKKKIYKYIPYS